MKIRLQGLAAIALGLFVCMRIYQYYTAHTSGEDTTIYLPKICMPIFKLLGIEKGLIALTLLPLIIILYGLRKMIFKIEG